MRVFSGASKLAGLEGSDTQGHNPHNTWNTICTHNESIESCKSNRGTYADRLGVNQNPLNVLPISMTALLGSDDGTSQCKVSTARAQMFLPFGSNLSTSNHIAVAASSAATGSCEKSSATASICMHELVY